MNKDFTVTKSNICEKKLVQSVSPEKNSSKSIKQRKKKTIVQAENSPPLPITFLIVFP